MKKYLIIVMALTLVFAFCSCGTDAPEEPSALSPSDIQVEDADGVNVYSVIYDIDNSYIFYINRQISYLYLIHLHN